MGFAKGSSVLNFKVDREVGKKIKHAAAPPSVGRKLCL